MTEGLDITYAGIINGRHAFSMAFQGLKPLETLAIKTDVQAWIINNVDGEVVCGHGLVPDAAFGILFDDIGDIELFEDVFPVRGYSPTLTH